jgi:uncharacterized protein YdaU (DUF1376 family)
MPLYVADYLRDTRKLTTAEHGAYLLLIMEYWTAKELPADDRQLSRIVGMTSAEWRKAKPNVQAFFTGGWRHRRIDDEIAKAEAKHGRRSEAGKRGGIASAKSKQNPSNADGNVPASSSQPQSERKEEKEDPADAVSSKYAFESGIIRLNQRDFDRWKASFSYLDLAAELVAITPWAEQQGPNWFHAVPNALVKRNREAKAAQEVQKKQPYNWNGIEGVV